MLELIRDHLMQPDAVKAFIAAYHQEINAMRDHAAHERGQLDAELQAAATKVEGMYNAVADGLRTTGIFTRTEALEGRKAEIEAELANPVPSPVRLHPNLAERYRRKTAALCVSLADPPIRDEAIEIPRGLIDEVCLGHGDDGWSVEPLGEITSLDSLGLQDDKAHRLRLRDEVLRSAKVVAGASNQLCRLWS